MAHVEDDAYENISVTSPASANSSSSSSCGSVVNTHGYTNPGFDNERNMFPLEVGVNSNNPPHESFLSENEYYDADGTLTVNCTRCSTQVNISNELTRQKKAVSFYLSPKKMSWLLYLSGLIGMSFLNPLCCILAMKYANPSVLAPFSGLTLVWVVLFSSHFVGERPGMSQKAACALIVFGEVLVAIFGDHTNGEEKSVEDVLSSYHEPAFCMFIVIMTLYLTQLGIFIWVCPETSLLKKVAWGCIGGSFTGFQNFLKDSLTIISAEKKSPTTGPPAVLFLFIALGILTAFVGLLFLAACMKRYDATYSASMFVVSFVLSASLMSLVHYHTLEHLDTVVNYVLYPVGLMTVFLGAFILVKPWSRNP